jgi:hypothetical protein
MINPTTVENCGELKNINASIIPQIADLLPSVSGYLLETVYGPACLTVSGRQVQLSERLALAILVDHIQLAGISFSIDRDDLPSLAMVQTATLLSRSWLTTAGNARPCASLNLQASESDRMTARTVAFRPYPSRELSDCGYMRNRIAEVSSHIQPLDDWRATVRRLGQCAGERFANAADALIAGGAR